ncbi:MAG: hypothetical protein RLZZ598_376, partial [Pseudomonadota bacterium]
MEYLNPIVHALPWGDWIALVWFFLAWIGYARFAHRRSQIQPSLLGMMQRVRHDWMLQTTY